MRLFIESLKRLYKCHAIDRDMIENFRQEGKISVDEKRYILEDV